MIKLSFMSKINSKTIKKKNEPALLLKISYVMELVALNTTKSYSDLSIMRKDWRCLLWC